MVAGNELPELLLYNFAELVPMVDTARFVSTPPLAIVGAVTTVERL